MKDIILQFLGYFLYYSIPFLRDCRVTKWNAMNYLSNFEKSNSYRRGIHDLIPGGTHTYSKGDDQFPKIAPAAIKKGKGAYVWDLDDNKYLDSSMGLSSVSLGHAYEPVLQRVREGKRSYSKQGVTRRKVLAEKTSTCGFL